MVQDLFNRLGNEYFKYGTTERNGEQWYTIEFEKINIDLFSVDDKRIFYNNNEWLNKRIRTNKDRIVLIKERTYRRKKVLDVIYIKRHNDREFNGTYKSVGALKNTINSFLQFGTVAWCGTEKFR